MERSCAALLTEGLRHERAPTGWQRGVWAKLEHRRRRRWWMLGTLPMLVGAATVAALALAPVRFAVDLQVVPGEGPATRSEHKLGDLIVATAGPVSSGRAVDVRVFEDGRLLVSCGRGAPECARRRDRLEVRVKLRARLPYRTVVVSGPAPLPPAADSYDEDQAAVHERGLTIERTLDVEPL